MANWNRYISFFFPSIFFCDSIFWFLGRAVSFGHFTTTSLMYWLLFCSQVYGPGHAFLDYTLRCLCRWRKGHIPLIPPFEGQKFFILQTHELPLFSFVVASLCGKPILALFHKLAFATDNYGGIGDGWCKSYLPLVEQGWCKVPYRLGIQGVLFPFINVDVLCVPCGPLINFV